MISRYLLRMCSAALLLVLVGCSTPDSRIANDQPLFESFAPDVQAKIRAGHIDIGFTAPMVKMAFGEPNRIYTRATAKGEEEVWAYQDQGPAFSFGVGVAGGGRSSAMGAGVGVSTGDRRGDKVRIIFQSGIVAAIETVKRQ